MFGRNMFGNRTLGDAGTDEDALFQQFNVQQELDYAISQLPTINPVVTDVRPVGKPTGGGARAPSLPSPYVPAPGAPPMAQTGAVADIARKLGMTTTQVILFAAMLGGAGYLIYKRGNKRGRR
jgi:hypothetical protein